MRVDLINTYSAGNLGDAAIYAALAWLLRGADLEWRGHDAARAGRTPAADGPTADLRISVGGDIFNNARPALLTRTFLSNLALLRAGPTGRTILFGQSVPPSCRSLAFRLLAHNLRRLAAVCVRDEESCERLRRAGVNAELTWDTAFALEPGREDLQAAERLFASRGIRPARAAVVSVRSFNSMYRHDAGGFLTRMIRLCDLLEARGHQPAILIQSRADAADSDAAVAGAIRAARPSVAVLDPFDVEEGTPPWRIAAGALGLARIAVAVRYHTAVLRALYGRSSYNLFYSNKGADLVRRAGMSGCEVGEFDPSRELVAIEASADATVDIASIRRRVRSDFAAAVARVSPTTGRLACA